MEDIRIVELLWQRKEEALEAASGKYASFLTGLARRLTDSPEDAEECANDALLAAWNSIPPQRPEKLGAYLAKLTRRIALDRYRRNTALKRGAGEAEDSLEELEELIPAGGTLSEGLEAEELAAVISDFLRQLPEADRRLFVRRYFYFETAAELARQEGFGESRVKMSLKRSRDKLAKELVKEGYVL